MYAFHVDGEKPYLREATFCYLVNTMIAAQHVAGIP
jgi:hypothetical protein